MNFNTLKRKQIRPLKPRLAGLLVIMFFWPVTYAFAGLPTRVDDTPLPSLAPMLERVLPAVVNVSVTNLSTPHSGMLQEPFFGSSLICRKPVQLPSKVPGRESSWMPKPVTS